jgi:uroporphyrinogen decarboxylase
MQLGFDRYLELMHERPALFERLMRINEEFCVAWANAQLQAGATAICYFDPVSSITIVPREQYLKTGFVVAQRTLARIAGPTATHLASGRCQPILPDVIRTGTAVVGVSAEENLAELKAISRGKVTLLGNLNGIALRHWTPAQTEAVVKMAIRQAGAGGGFILSDNHGEMPWQVPEAVLMAIMDTVRVWGKYPLEGRGDHEA